MLRVVQVMLHLHDPGDSYRVWPEPLSLESDHNLNQGLPFLFRLLQA